MMKLSMERSRKGSAYYSMTLCQLLVSFMDSYLVLYAVWYLFSVDTLDDFFAKVVLISILVAPGPAFKFARLYQYSFENADFGCPNILRVPDRSSVNITVIMITTR